MNDFWKPQFKWQLESWQIQRYPKNKWKFRKMGKKQLYAIYYNIRKGENDEN